MATIQPYNEEDYGRMEFLAYFLLAFALVGIGSIMYFFFNWLSG